MANPPTGTEYRNPKLAAPAGPGSAILVLAALVIVLAGMKVAADIVVPFLLAVFLATLTGPSVFWLHRHRVPKVLALLIVLGSVLGFFALIGTVTFNSMQEFNRNLPSYEAQLLAQTKPLQAWVEDVLVRFGLGESWGDLLPALDPRSALGFAGATLALFGSGVTKVFLAVVMVAFLLGEAFSLPAKVTAAIGPAEKTLDGFRTFASSVQKYLVIKTATSLLTGLSAGFWVWFMGVDYPVFWGMLAFLFNYIPNIGSFVAAAPAVLMALVQLGPGSAAVVAIGYLAINVCIGSILEPKTMGDGVGLSPLVVVMSLVFWGWLLGGVGMLLSTPLTISVKIALANYDTTRWISTLIGSGKAKAIAS